MYKCDIYMCMCIYIYTHTHRHYICTSTIYIHTHVYVYIYIYIFHVYVCVCVYIYTHTPSLNTHTFYHFCPVYQLSVPLILVSFLINIGSVLHESWKQWKHRFVINRVFLHSFSPPSISAS